jgi:hypothetical protein
MLAAIVVYQSQDHFCSKSKVYIFSCGWSFADKRVYFFTFLWHNCLLLWCYMLLRNEPINSKLTSANLVYQSAYFEF